MSDSDSGGTEIELINFSNQKEIPFSARDEISLWPAQL